MIERHPLEPVTYEDAIINMIGSLRWGANIDRASGDNSMDALLKGSTQVSQVSGGPNQGYWYFGSNDYEFDRAFVINGQFMANGDSILNGDNSYEILSADTLLSPDPFLDGVTGHETTGWLGANGHQGQLEFLASDHQPTCGNLVYYIEPLVGPDSLTVNSGLTDALAAAEATWEEGAALHHYVWGNHADTASAVDPNKSWVVFPSTSSPPVVYHAEYDRQQARTLNPLYQCDWSGL